MNEEFHLQFWNYKHFCLAYKSSALGCRELKQFSRAGQTRQLSRQYVKGSALSPVALAPNLASKLHFDSIFVFYRVTEALIRCRLWRYAQKLSRAQLCEFWHYYWPGLRISSRVIIIFQRVRVPNYLSTCWPGIMEIWRGYLRCGSSLRYYCHMAEFPARNIARKKYAACVRCQKSRVRDQCYDIWIRIRLFILMDPDPEIIFL